MRKVGSKNYYGLAGGLVLLAILAFYMIVDPGQLSWAPKCPVHTLTGYDCPGCGSQRAVHALLQGEFREAWNHNALLLVLLPFIAAIGASEIFRKRNTRLHFILHSPLVGWSLLGVIILWTVIRNIPGIF